MRVAILRGMDGVLAALNEKGWGLGKARALAREIEGSKRGVRALVTALFSAEGEVRKRAADVARRITEVDARPLWPYADELAGLLAEVPVEESRTRWHMGLVVARVAHTRDQRLRAAQLMMLLAGDESNVARCSAVEGIGLLAVEEASLRGEAEEMIERALWDGTKAMKCRARVVMRMWARGERRKK